MIKIGVIGLGNIGFAHAQRVHSIRGVELAAGADLREEILQKFEDNFGKPGYKEYNKIIENEDIDGVIIALPNFLHAKVAIEALKSGKHVLVEKPPALNYRETKRMVEEASRSGRVLLLGMVNRFYEPVKDVKRVIESGKLGKPYYGRTCWLRTSGIPGWGSWFTMRDKAGSGPVFDIGVHMLDMILWSLHYPKPKAVAAYSWSIFGPEKRGLSNWGTIIPQGAFDVEDGAVALLHLKGISIMMEVSWAGYEEEGKHIFEVLCSRGGIKADLRRGIVEERSGKLSKRRTVIRRYRRQDILLREDRHFVRCIKGLEEPITTPDEILTLQRILDGIIEAADKGDIVRF